MAINPMTGDVTRTKYRKRGKLVTVTRRTTCRVREVESGAVFDMDEPAFDREYERVEEKRKPGLGICVDCRQVITWRDGHHPEGAAPRCLECAEKLSKKPTPQHCQHCGVSMDGLVQHALGAQDCLCSHCFHAPKAERKPTPSINRCFGCGCSLYADRISAIGYDGQIRCGPCHCSYAAEYTKPKPLTLADLKPGDVFRFAECMFCQEEHQLLRASELWCPTKGSEEIDHSDVRVERLHHHPLTPKQLLWIAASDKEREALDESIRAKWLPILRGEKRGNRHHDCPLCQLANGPGGWQRCRSCLIGKATGLYSCAGTPWSTSAEAGDYPQARAFTLWLAEFQPPIHPTRLEVEATPEEWPGAQK